MISRGSRPSDKGGGLSSTPWDKGGPGLKKKFNGPSSLNLVKNKGGGGRGGLTGPLPWTRRWWYWTSNLHTYWFCVHDSLFPNPTSSPGSLRFPICRWKERRLTHSIGDGLIYFLYANSVLIAFTSTSDHSSRRVLRLFFNVRRFISFSRGIRCRVSFGQLFLSLMFIRTSCWLTLYWGRWCYAFPFRCVCPYLKVRTKSSPSFSMPQTATIQTGFPPVEWFLPLGQTSLPIHPLFSASTFLQTGPSTLLHL